MANHSLPLDCGQKVFCGSPQQQMSSLWETNLVLTPYVDGLPPGCLYYWVYFLSLSHSLFSYMLQQPPICLFHSSLAFCLLFATVLVMAYCILFILLRISIFKAIPINSLLSSLSNYSIYVLLHSCHPVFMSLFVSLLLIFPSRSSSTHHLSPRFSHLLSKQLGFLNSRLWQ